MSKGRLKRNRPNVQHDEEIRTPAARNIASSSPADALYAAHLLEPAGHMPAGSRSQAAFERGVLALQTSQGNRYVERLVGPNPSSSNAVQNRAEVAARLQIQRQPKGKGKINETYAPAAAYVNRYFDRQRDIVRLLSSARDRGLEQFKIFSSEEYNKDDSILMAVFEVALSLVPAAAGLRKAFSALRQGGELFAVKNLIERLSDIKEGLEKGAEPVKKIAGAAGGSEAKAMGDFQSRALTTLGQLDVKEVGAMWAAEDAIYAKLENARFQPEDVDLEAMVTRSLGDLPKIEGLEAVVEAVGEQFEMQLYREYYVKSGRAYWLYRKQWGGGTINDGVQGIPEGLMNHIRKKPWNLRILAGLRQETVEPLERGFKV